jgi:hypothetical protein
VLLLAVIPAAFGQASAVNGSIEGTVTDATGAVVSGAKVQVRNVSIGFTASAATDTSGFYRFNVLPLGSYEVSAQVSGFAPYRQTGIVLNAGTNARADITLQVSSAATEVQITSAAPVAEPDRIDLGSTLSSNAVQNLPLVSRNPFNFILFQPNVSGRANTEFGVPRKLNANGFNGRINYQLDGTNNTESDRAGIRLLPISDTWVQEIQQVSNGFAPEFGNTVGTVFNTITRSGTNDLHGEGAYIFRRTPFSARPALLSATAPTPDVNVDSYVGDAGGRLIRDKAFWFGAFEHVNRDLPAPVTVSPATISQLGLPANFADAIPFRQSVYFYMAKVDYQLNQSNRLSVRYNHHANDSPYNNSTIGGLFLVSRSFNFVDRSHAGAVQLVTTFSPNVVNELRGQISYRGQSQERFSATGSGPALVISGVANFGGPTDVGFIYQETTPELNDSLSYNVGAHALKTGFSVRSIRDTQVQPTFAQYTFSDIASYLAAVNGTKPLGYTNFQQTYGNPSIDYRSLFTGVFAQDTWKLRRNATLTYGVRYDVYKVPDANSSSPFPYSQNFRTDKNNVAPRLGLAVGLGKEQKTVIRASTGIFFDPPQTDQYRKAILNNGSPIFFNITANPSTSWAPAFPTTFTSLPAGFGGATGDITTVSPDFATLYSANANVSVSRELSTNLVVTGSYLFTRGNRLPVYRNINLVPSGRFLADGRPIFGTARVYPGFGNILVAESVGQSTYSGANLTINKRWSRGYEFYATYTWSHATDDAPEQNNIDSSNFLLSDPTNRRRDHGNSLTDKRHVFNMTGVFLPEFHAGTGIGNYLINHNQLSVTAVAASGDVFNLGSNRFLNGDLSEGTAFQRPLFIGRNTLRGPANFELNARYSRLFPITERFTAEFFGESTNVLNKVNVIGINSTATVDETGAITKPASLAPTSARDQRLIQLGIRVRF